MTGLLGRLAGGDDAGAQARLLGLGGVHEVRRQAQVHRPGLFPLPLQIGNIELKNLRTFLVELGFYIDAL